MDEARRRFQAHQYYVPEMLIACRAMKAAMKQIRPRLTDGDSLPTACVSVIGLTYQPEELTVSLVADLLEGAGLQVTRSTLAAPEAHRDGQWGLAESAVAVLVVPLCALSRASTCWHSPARDTVKSLCCECASRGAKVILMGGDPGWLVFIGQFAKGIECSELAALERLSDQMTVHQFGRSCFVRRTPDLADRRLAEQGLTECKRVLLAGIHRLVILDEAGARQGRLASPPERKPKTVLSQ